MKRRKRFRNRVRAFCKSRVFKNAHRSVPDDRLCAFDDVCEKFLRFNADIESHFVVGNALAVNVFDRYGCVDGIGERRNDCAVDGKINFFAEDFRFVKHVFAIFEFFVVDQRQTFFAALRFQEGISHAAADDKSVAFVKQVVDYVKFVGDFRAAEYCDERVYGMFETVRHDRQFFFDKETANRRLYKTVFDDSGGRRVRTVRRTESVVDVNVRVFGKSLAEVFVPAFFAGVETQVFKKYAFAVL